MTEHSNLIAKSVKLNFRTPLADDVFIPQLELLNDKIAEISAKEFSGDYKYFSTEFLFKKDLKDSDLVEIGAGLLNQ